MKKIILFIVLLLISNVLLIANKADLYFTLPGDSLESASSPYSVTLEMHVGIDKTRLLIDLQNTGFSGNEVFWKINDRPFFSTADSASFHKISVNEIVSQEVISFIPDAAGLYVIIGSDGSSREILEITLTVYKKKSLVMILDGVRADALLNSGAEQLAQLIEKPWQRDYETAYSLKARTVPDANPNSGANHASIMNGVTAAKHGVFTNAMFKEAAADIVSYPHYLDILEQTNPEIRTAFLASWGADYTMIQSADFQRKGQGGHGRASITEDKLISNYTENILQGYRTSIPGSGGTEWIGGDIDALFIFFDTPDAGGHGFDLDILGCVGFYPYNPDYLEMIRLCDSYIETAMETVSRRPDFAYEDWQFVFTTDHGGFGTSHGYCNASTLSVWFMHTAKDLKAGELVGIPNNYDLAATVLHHFGLDTEEMKQEGKQDGTAQVMVKPKNLYQSPVNAPESLVDGDLLSMKFDADGFTVVMKYNHPWYDVFRSQHAIFSTPSELESAGIKFGIFTDYEFWTGIGGLWGRSDGSITYDDRDSDQNRSIGVTSAWGSEPIDIYSLVPESGRDTFIGFSVDGEGNAILYSDRSDGYLYFITGSLATPGSPFGNESVQYMTAGEFVSEVTYWSSEITPQEMIAYYHNNMD
ncbi:MAG: alkaline phosphatase family protein [Bacteroidetes bacterium]|nr:alkaline phosphatase family protein [Bacteroidota bacterium]